MSRTRYTKGTYTKISAKGHNMFSQTNIKSSAAKNINEQGIENGEKLGTPSDPPVAEIDILADAIVHFRPMNKWRGEDYGIDWMRVDDTGLPGDNKYSDMMGTYDIYPSTNNTGESNNTLSTFTKSMTMYDKLKKEYCNPVYKIPWLLKKDKKPTDYFTSWLCVEKDKEVTLSLRVLLKDKKVLPTDLVIAYDKSLCEITTTVGKGSEDTKQDPSKKLHFAKIIIKKDDNYKLQNEVKIKVIKEISSAQTIKVLCDGKEAGFLMLYPNKVKKLNVACVSVIATLKNGGNIKGKTELIEFLKQSLITTNILDVVLDIKKNNDGSPNKDIKSPTILNNGEININGKIDGKSIHDYLDEKLKQEFKSEDGNGLYDNYLRLYFFNEKAYYMKGDNKIPIGGIGFPISGARGLMFNTINDIDVAHEAMHAIALGHSFGIKTNIDNITPYLYEYMKTDNIMDYANLGGGQKFATWKWQWDKIRNFKLLLE